MYGVDSNILAARNVWDLRLALMHKLPSGTHDQYLHGRTSPDHQFEQYTRFAAARRAVNIQPAMALNPILLIVIRHAFLRADNGFLLLWAPFPRPM